MEEKFLELETKWMKAWMNKDEETIRRILSNDFTLTSTLSKGELVNKDEWINKAMHHYHCRFFRFDKIKLRLYENTAILNGWFYQEATANGKDWNGSFLLTDIWIKKQDEWQVVARHASWLQ